MGREGERGEAVGGGEIGSFFAWIGRPSLRVRVRPIGQGKTCPISSCSLLSALLPPLPALASPLSLSGRTPFHAGKAPQTGGRDNKWDLKKTQEGRWKNENIKIRSTNSSLIAVPEKNMVVLGYILLNKLVFSLAHGSFIEGEKLLSFFLVPSGHSAPLHFKFSSWAKMAGGRPQSRPNR